MLKCTLIRMLNVSIISLVGNNNENEGPDSELDEDGRPCFSSIAKSSGFLDHELVASGFTKKDQDEIERFIEGGNDDEDGASSGKEEDKRVCHEERDGLEGRMDSFHLAEQVTLTDCDVNTDNEEDCSQSAVKEDNDPVPVQPTNEEDDSSKPDVEDPVLLKQLYKQRQKAIASARAGSRASSRNSYKDKGGKTSQNSKIQKQLAKW